MNLSDQKQLLILQMKRAISLLEIDSSRNSTIKQTFLSIRKDSISYEKEMKRQAYFSAQEAENIESPVTEQKKENNVSRQKRTRPQI